MNRESEDLPEQKESFSEPWILFEFNSRNRAKEMAMQNSQNGLTFVDRRWSENFVDKKGTSPD
jgi:hypothetical protein